jgi:hypothetical protein
LLRISIALLRPRPRKKKGMGDTPHSPRQLLYFPAGALDGGVAESTTQIGSIFISGWWPATAVRNSHENDALLGPPRLLRIALRCSAPAPGELSI